MPSNVGEYAIARAGVRDVNDIKSIEVECGLSSWTLTGYRSELERDDAVILLARVVSDDNTAVGFIAGRVPLTSGGEAEVYNIATVSSHRRRGIGEKLLRGFLETCLERGASGIWLEVRATNKSSIDFYISQGFVSRGSRPNFYTNPVEDAQLMFLQLLQPDVLPKS